MTQILLQNGIDNMQMNVLMGLFNSWNVDVVITEEKKQKNKSFSQLFSKTRGMWQDYAIDGEKLRNEAWGINEKTTVWYLLIQIYLLSITKTILQSVDLVKQYCLSHKLKLPDALIAATALVQNAKILTLNKKDFSHIPKVELFELT